MAEQLPPQSTSVSVPFLTPSEQVEALHMDPTQFAVWQSAATEQLLPVAHLPHVLPPQSVSVSVPFFVWSEQVGTWHVPPAHTLL